MATEPLYQDRLGAGDFWLGAAIGHYPAGGYRAMARPEPGWAGYLICLKLVASDHLPDHRVLSGKARRRLRGLLGNLVILLGEEVDSAFEILYP